MKEIVVISGKGGTGKTSIAASLFAIAGNAVAADCDVDAADMFIVLDPETVERHDFYSGRTAVIRQEKCINCGKCSDLCRFDAVIEKSGGYFINASECEGCSVCVEFCPVKAIDFIERNCGQWFLSNTRFGPFVHARLGIGAENSGKLVTAVRSQAKKTAVDKKADFIITDGPPGTGCPVIATITGADAVLIVTEPTLSGLHDLERALELTKHFRLKTAVVVNKWDINGPITGRIEDLAQNKGAFVPGRVSYNRDVTFAQINKKSIVEYDKEGMTSEEIKTIWSDLLKIF